MTTKPHLITLDQLSRLFDAANKANSELAAAHRAKPRDQDLIVRMRQRASALNSSYHAAKRQYKRQQKAKARAQWRTTMIRFYMDYQEKSSAA